MVCLSVLLVMFAVTLQSHKIYCDVWSEANMERPLVIAHRGASGQYPEHTLMAYQAAIDQGSDAVECDIVVTKDLQLVCVHQPWIKDITDVQHKFPDIVRNHYLAEYDYHVRDEYFTTDLTLAELKTLRLKQPLDFRDHSYDWQLQIPTFEEYLDLVGNAIRPVDIYPEIKLPEWINSLDILQDANTTVEELVVEALKRKGYQNHDDLCYLQCFSSSVILRLADITDVKLVFLSRVDVDNNQLDSIKDVCYGIGVSKNLVVPVNTTSNYLMTETDLVARAHQRDLKVHVYTMRNEDQYLAFDYGQDPYEEYARFTAAGVDGMFTDFPATMVRFQRAMGGHTCRSTSSSGAQIHVVSVPVTAILTVLSMLTACVLLLL